MCIAILNTSGKLNEESIFNSWNNNDQGGGLLWTSGGALFSYKTYKYNKFLKKYNELRSDNKTGKIVLHFRIATSGHEKYTNLHPFFVNANLGFVHNGIIQGLGNQQHSDTYQFNEMLQKLPSNFLTCPTQLEFIKKYIGGSKLVFLNSSDQYTIINEKAGHWDGANWYSNNSYECSLDYYYYGNKKVTKKQNFSIDWDSVDDYLTKKSGATKEDNMDYLADYWYNADPITVKTFLEYTGKDINDLDFQNFMEELAVYYDTADLKRLLYIFKEEETQEYFA
jgi:hypothetical protein